MAGIFKTLIRVGVITAVSAGAAVLIAGPHRTAALVSQAREHIMSHIDERIEDMNRYLEQREKALSTGFIRMEEMQSKINTQMQTLQNSFKK